MSDLHLIITELIEGTIDFYTTKSEAYIDLIVEYLDDNKFDYTLHKTNVDNDIIYTIILGD